ncbi:serine proteinase 2 [Crepidotus variabilis]|uniref:Serine proteinase 2 n=1 Tax=Crepidotus variabilis TaxID=179855 RepID=A0A9P6EFW8_9AGAR|nr:serine proteinase 2 [Crepidotus variabilis]
MRFTSVVVLALSLVPPALAAPAPLISVEKFDGQTNGKFIIKFKKEVSTASWYDKLSLHPDSVVEFDLLNGFASHLDTDTLNTLRASKDVEYIAEDGLVHAFDTQTNAPWGLNRISSPAKLLSGSATGAAAYTYTYDPSAGQGVDVYIVVTGLQDDFGGRAKWGKTVGGYNSADGLGHGTHCAGTIGGTQYGVAKKATLIAVKVLDDNGSGTISDMHTQAASTGNPSIVSMSLGGNANTALDDAVTTLIASGVHVVVAAGNESRDAKNVSPARVAAAITVGASDITDAMASFSNFGPIVDVFAPGVSVLSAWKGSNTATNVISGTSMATPHVAGLVAYLIGKDGNDTPAAIAAKVVSLSLKETLTKIPSGTVNDLAHNA